MNEPVKRSNARGRFTPPEDLRTADIPSSQVGPSTPPLIFMLDAHDPARVRRQRRMFAQARLDAGFLIRREDIIGWTQRHAIPDPFVEIEDLSGLLGELWIAWEQPASVTPRTDGILGQPAPQGCSADAGHKTLLKDFALDFRETEAREGKSTLMRDLARQGLDLNDDAGGKSGLAARLGVAPPGQAVAARRNVYATC